MSYRFDHPAIAFAPLATGELYCIVPANRELAPRLRISGAGMTRRPLIGIDPSDPYGRSMAELFARDGLAYDIRIRARFGMAARAPAATAAASSV